MGCNIRTYLGDEVFRKELFIKGKKGQFLYVSRETYSSYTHVVHTELVKNLRSLEIYNPHISEGTHLSTSLALIGSNMSIALEHEDPEVGIITWRSPEWGSDPLMVRIDAPLVGVLRYGPYLGGMFGMKEKLGVPEVFTVNIFQHGVVKAYVFKPVWRCRFIYLEYVGEGIPKLGSDSQYQCEKGYKIVLSTYQKDDLLRPYFDIYIYPIFQMELEEAVGWTHEAAEVHLNMGVAFEEVENRKVVRWLAEEGYIRKDIVLYRKLLYRFNTVKRNRPELISELWELFSFIEEEHNLYRL